MALPEWLSDDPIEQVPDDMFERHPYAARICAQIKAFPGNASVRFGVFGSWGEGKTSFARLIQRGVESQGDLAINILGWPAKAPDQVLADLIDSICRSLNISIDWRLKTDKLLKKAAEITATAQGFDPRIDLAGRVLNRSLSPLLRRQREGALSGLLKIISSRLGERRLVVFVDDLDRAEPSILIDLLLTLREGFSIPRTHFILTLDPDVVGKGLGQTHPGFQDSPHSFLDKIIEYQFYLAPPSEEAIRRFVTHCVAHLGDAVNSEALMDIIPVLPKNPRRLKLYLRHMASLGTQLHRFSPDEVNLQKLYLAQLLRMECPSESFALAEDLKTLQAMDHAQIQLMASGAVEPTSYAEEKYADPRNEERKKLFLKISKAIRACAPKHLTYTLHDMLVLSEDAIPVTFKELTVLLESLDASPEEATEQILEQFMEQSVTSWRRRMRGLFLKALEGRDRLLSHAADAGTNDGIQATLVQLPSLDRILSWILVTRASLNDGVLSVDDWVEFLKHLRRWSRFRGFRYYDDVRNAEAALIRQVVGSASTELRGMLLDSIEFPVNTILRDASNEFLEVLRESREMLEVWTAEKLVSRFRHPDGVDILWGQRGNQSEKRIAFDPGSPFHRSPIRDEFLRLVAESTENSVIHDNVLLYLTMLTYGATERGSFPKESCEALLRDQAFFLPLWRGALARPLNLRNVGTLRGRLKELQERGILPKDLYKPEWWMVYEAEHFQAEKTNDQRDDPTGAETSE